MADLGLDRREGLVQLAVAAEVPGEDHGIDLARLEHGGVHALEVPEVLLAGAREIDRVGGDDRRRDRRQARRELGRERRQLEACLGDEVGSDDARATAVPDDRDPPAGRTVGSKAPERAVDQLLRRRHPHDPGGPAGRLDRGRVARERSRVRSRRARPRLAASRREEDHLLAGCERSLARAGEGPAVAEVLAVDADHAGVLVRSERLDQLRRLDVGLIAERGEAGDADAVLGAEQAQLEREVAALGDEPERAGLELVHAEIERGRCVVDAEAVRAEHHRSGISHLLDHAALELLAAARPPRRSRR